MISAECESQNFASSFGPLKCCSWIAPNTAGVTDCVRMMSFVNGERMSDDRLRFRLSTLMSADVLLIRKSRCTRVSSKLCMVLEAIRSCPT